MLKLVLVRIAIRTVAVNPMYFLAWLLFFLFSLFKEFAFNHIKVLVHDLVADLRNESQDVNVVTAFDRLSDPNIALAVPAHSL